MERKHDLIKTIQFQQCDGVCVQYNHFVLVYKDMNCDVKYHFQKDNWIKLGTHPPIRLKLFNFSTKELFKNMFKFDEYTYDFRFIYKKGNLTVFAEMIIKQSIITFSINRQCWGWPPYMRKN